MIKLYCPDNLLIERKYIYDVVFDDFLGLEYELIIDNNLNSYIEIFLNGIVIKVKDIFFGLQKNQYLKPDSLPKRPLQRMVADDEEMGMMLVNKVVPIIYGDGDGNDRYIIWDNGGCSVGIDIFGSIFFMLTRYEELLNKKRDIHGRFCAVDSLCYQEGFIDRPIVNEYIEILWYILKKIDTSLIRKKRKFNILPTHDVDNLFVKAQLPLYMRVRELVGDIVKRHDIRLFLDNLKLIKEILPGKFNSEWKLSFDYIMSKSESLGLKSTFFLMSAQGQSENDGDYNINDSLPQALAREIISRGHNIGIHPSYSSMADYDVLKDNVLKLQDMLVRNKINISRLGGRQHCLMWDVANTWNLYESVGLQYDSSLAFADYVGFRCGTCYEFPVFDLLNRHKLKLYEYPLIVMDVSGLKYMKLSPKDMINICRNLKQICKKYDGNFVILWHNNQIIQPSLKNIYEAIITE